MGSCHIWSLISVSPLFRSDSLMLSSSRFIPLRLPRKSLPDLWAFEPPTAGTQRIGAYLSELVLDSSILPPHQAGSHAWANETYFSLRLTPHGTRRGMGVKIPYHASIAALGGRAQPALTSSKDIHILRLFLGNVVRCWVQSPGLNPQHTLVVGQGGAALSEPATSCRVGSRRLSLPQRHRNWALARPIAC